MPPFDIEFAIKGLLWVSGVLGSGLIGVVLWSAKEVIGRIESLERVARTEFRAFDRRLTRVETVLRITPPAEDLPGEMGPLGR